MQRLRRPFDAVTLLAIVFVLLAMATSGIYWQSMLAKQDAMRETARQRNALRASQLNEAVTQQLDATLRSVDIALKHLRLVYQQGPVEFERAAQDVVMAYPPGMIETIAILDAQGRLHHASTYQPRRRFAPYSGDKEHFRVHAEASIDTLFISPPIKNPASNESLIHLTRGIWQQHRFAGVISIPVRPEYLSSHLLSLRVDPSDILAVVRPDGSTLARSHGLAEAMKSKLPPDRPFFKAERGASGQFRSTSTFDKVPLLFSWQRLKDWPLITVAAVNEATELAPLNRAMEAERQHTAQTIALLIVSSIVLLLMVLRSQQQKRALHLSEAQHRALFESSKIPMLLIEPGSGAIVDANAAASAFYGYALDAMRQMRITDFNQLSPAQIHSEMNLARQEKRSCFYFPHRLANGEVREVEVHSGPIEANGRMLLYSFIHDITDRKRLEDQVRQLAFHDVLTGLPNRRMLMDRLTQTIATLKRTGRYAALLFLDLDNFKPLNDLHGHDAGDLLLAQAAARLTACVRETDTVARFGGDEFVVMLNTLTPDKEASINQSLAIAEKILQSLAQPYVLTVHQPKAAALVLTHHCTASIGLTLFCTPNETAEGLLSQADAAMYQAKEAGRNQTRLYVDDARPGDVPTPAQP
jgi:diguanylate cyclase (GGDEF)-like protein/PAS domain S-box-containing protein